ncbi:MAG: hypothetical protein R3F10_03355 [Lysobacteraceae bacterium]
MSLPDVTMPIAGGETTMAATFTGDGTTVAYQCNVTYDPADVSVVSVTGVGNGLCSNPTAGTIVLLDGTPNNTPMANGTTCNIVLFVILVLMVPHYGWTPYNCVFNNAGGAEIPGQVDHGSITLIAAGPPTITFVTTPINLPAGAFGATVSANIPTTFTPGGGSNPADTASFTCSASTGFTVSPTSGGPFNNSGSMPTVTVSATLGAAVQNGTVNCTATNTSGSSVPFAIPVTAPAGAQTLPNLASSPASGATITLPAGLPGSTVSSNITITPSGGAGVTPATVTCSATAPVTVNPTTQLSFLPGTTTPQNVAVQCLLLEDVEQTGSVTCTGTSGAGQFTWNYSVVCPAGVNTPAIVPATSAWSKFALIALFAGLGLLMVGFRRQH